VDERNGLLLHEEITRPYFDEFLEECPRHSGFSSRVFVVIDRISCSFTLKSVKICINLPSIMLINNHYFPSKDIGCVVVKFESGSEEVSQVAVSSPPQPPLSIFQGAYGPFKKRMLSAIKT